VRLGINLAIKDDKEQAPARKWQIILSILPKKQAA
jgi:hypothetical protein